MANRYTRRQVRAQYNPISFEQFAQAPLMAQALHDKTIGEVMAQQEYLNNLPWHEKEARALEKELEGQIDSVTGKITNSDRGIYDVDPVTELSNIRTYKREKFMPKQSQIQLALQNRQDLKKRYQELVDKGDATSLEMQEALAIFDKQSKAALKDDIIGYDGRVLAMDPGINKMIVDYISKLPASEIERDYGWKLDRSRGVWVNVTTGEKTNGTPQELKNLAMNYIMQDPKAMAYFQDRAMVAEELYSEKDAMGNIIYGGKYYNPDEFRDTIIRDQIDRAGSVAEPFSYTNRTRKEEIKNLSDWQISAYGLNGANFDESHTGTGSVRDSNFTLDNRIKKLPTDKNGNVLSQDQIDAYFLNEVNRRVEERMMTKEQADSFQETLLPQLRKMLIEQDYKAPNELVRSFNNVINGFSGLGGDIANSLRRIWGNDPKVNLEGILSTATDLMFVDGVSFDRITEEQRDILREQRRTQLQDHRDNAEVQFYDGTDFKQQEFESDYEAEQVYSTAFGNTVQPQIKGFVTNETRYLDPNAQEAVKSNSLASLASANAIMVLDEDNELLYGEEARDWINAHSEVNNISMPEFVTSGLNTLQAGFLGGTALTVDYGENKSARVIVASNSDRIKAAVEPLRALAEIESDYNMSLNGQVKEVTWQVTPREDANKNVYNEVRGLEYINSVQNGQAVTLVKPYFEAIDADGNRIGKREYHQSEKGNVAVYDLNTFKDQFVFPQIESMIARGANYTRP